MDTPSLVTATLPAELPEEIFQFPVGEVASVVLRSAFAMLLEVFEPLTEVVAEVGIPPGNGVDLLQPPPP